MKREERDRLLERVREVIAENEREIRYWEGAMSFDLGPYDVESFRVRLWRFRAVESSLLRISIDEDGEPDVLD